MHQHWYLILYKINNGNVLFHQPSITSSDRNRWGLQMDISKISIRHIDILMIANAYWQCYKNLCSGLKKNKNTHIYTFSTLISHKGAPKISQSIYRSKTNLPKTF